MLAQGPHGAPARPRAGPPGQRGGAGFLARLKWSFMASEGGLSRIGPPPSCGAAVAAFTGRFLDPPP